MIERFEPLQHPAPACGLALPTACAKAIAVAQAATRRRGRQDSTHQHANMKGTNLGELEELVLLVVAVLYDNAYGVSIQNELLERCDRDATLSTIHVALHRLEEKGYLDSRMDGATNERGGRRKLLFRVTKSGQKSLAKAYEMRNDLWHAIPKTAFNI